MKPRSQKKLGIKMKEAAKGIMPSFVTDVCVCEEQDEHIVFAVRVPRQTIADNMATLAWMSGTTMPRRLPTAEPDAADSKWNFWGRKNLIRAAVATAAATVVVPAAIGWQSPQPPIELISSRVDTPVVEQGGTLRLTILVQRHRLCPVDVEKMLTRVSDGVIVWRVRQPSVGFGITKDTIQYHFAMKLPGGLVPGKYTYTAQTYSDCHDGGGVYATRNDGNDFKVVEHL